MINKIRAEFLFSKGQKQAKHGLLEESINSFDKALSFSPSYSGIYLHKALSLSTLKKYSDAQQTLKKAIEMKPKNTAYHLFMGVIHYDHRNYEEAFNSFETTIELCPDNYLALCYKNLILLVQGKKIDEAGDLLRQYLKHANHDFQSKFLEFCETICFQNRKSDKSFDILHELNSEISEEPSSNILASFSLALMSFIYDLLYFSNPVKKSSYKHYNKAIRAQLTGQFDEAIKEYREALKIYAEFNDAADKLIELYWNKKSYHSFLIFIKELPVYGKISSLISTCRSASKEGKDIERDIMQHSPLIFMLAYAYYQIGDYDNSFELFAIISKYGHQNALVFYSLALCYIAKNDTDEARIAFKLSLEKLLDQRVLYNRLEQTLKLLGESLNDKRG